MEYTLSVGDVVRFSGRENSVVTRLPDDDYSYIVFLCEDGMYDECSVDYFKMRFSDGSYRIVGHIDIQSVLDQIRAANE